MEKLPLCVDLDGTLSRTDTLHELLLALIKSKPFSIFKCLIWLFQSKSAFKANLAREINVSPKHLIYNQAVLDYLKNEHGTRDIYLVTGSNERTAHNIAQHINLFNDVIASDLNTNVTGKTKQSILCEKFGQKGYEYIGNEKTDYPVWDDAGSVSVTSPIPRFLTEVKARYPTATIFELPKPSFKDYVKAARVHQWTKNLLIFVPLLLDHRLFDLPALLSLTLAFFSFSFLASATYLLNDLLDLASDRASTYKSKRALASGLISIKSACCLIAILVIASVSLAMLLPVEFGLIIAAYTLATLAYSFRFKTVAIFDVCILASLFTARVIAGTLTISSGWSFWLLAFSMFFFLSLAISKRASELHNLAKKSENASVFGRGYYTNDLPVLMSSGIASGYISILVVSLYINSDKVAVNYTHPEILWLICPLLMYWVGRIWLKTGRGEMTEDPIVFALRDKVSLKAFALISIIVLTASLIR